MPRERKGPPSERSTSQTLADYPAEGHEGKSLDLLKQQLKTIGFPGFLRLNVPGNASMCELSNSWARCMRSADRWKCSSLATAARV